MTTMINVTSQILSDNQMVDFDALIPSRYGAQPENLAGEYSAFVEQMTDAAGNKYQVWYGFSSEEMDACDGDAGNLDFDSDHVVKIVDLN